MNSICCKRKKNPCINQKYLYIKRQKDNKGLIQDTNWRYSAEKAKKRREKRKRKKRNRKALKQKTKMLSKLKLNSEYYFRSKYYTDISDKVIEQMCFDPEVYNHLRKVTRWDGTGSVPVALSPTTETA